MRYDVIKGCMDVFHAVVSLRNEGWNSSTFEQSFIHTREHKFQRHFRCKVLKLDGLNGGEVLEANC